ncbi:GntR family transcriptional regulator [Mesorhizobium sp. LjNodule214]|uniref:GntR family transcriptional regulator n=1 Tax=Mesorhizobium sp. LjNodule214 TaxID=3342252 RepID=UPI003ED0A073
MVAIGRERPESPYRRLKELVVNYQFRPQEPLSPVSIADRLRVSATPVREALARLHGEELVNLVANRGFYAKTLDLKEMRDQYELALQISINAINRQFIDTEAMKVLSNLTRREMVAYSACRSEFIEDFYLGIAALTGNGVMSRSIRKFNDQTHFVRSIYLEADDKFSEIVDDMSTLVSVLERGNITDAITNLRRQRDKKLAQMSDLVREGLARSLIAFKQNGAQTVG